jgi:hypothetical protein
MIVDKDLGWNRIKEQLGSLKNIEIQIGLFGEGDSPENNVAFRGAVHEYGVPFEQGSRIPRRKFMSKAWDENLQDIEEFKKNEYDKVLKGQQNIKTMLDKIGVKHEGQIKRMIKEGNFEKLSEKTIAKKGSSKPLIDTAVMVNSIKYRIKGEK